jgi:hypothetical protein
MFPNRTKKRGLTLVPQSQTYFFYPSPFQRLTLELDRDQNATSASLAREVVVVYVLTLVRWLMVSKLLILPSCGAKVLYIDFLYYG